VSRKVTAITEPTIRVGVVGTGRLGREHARIYNGLDGVRLEGVVDADPACAAEVGRRLGVAHFGELEQLLARVHAVSVVVTTEAHAEVAAAALAAGVHVLVEKPITASVSEADHLIDLAHRQRLLLGVGHVERYGPAARVFMERVRDPRFIECHRLAPFNPRGTDVPVVLDLMIHDLDMFLAMAPGDVERVDAVGVPVLTPTADIANARIEFSGGLIANITASRVSREKMRKMRVFQPDGYLSLDYLNQRLTVYRRRSATEEPGPATMAMPHPHDPGAYIEREVVVPQSEELLALELTAFVKALRTGGPVPVSGADGRCALALAERIMEDMERRMASTDTAADRGVVRGEGDTRAC